MKKYYVLLFVCLFSIEATAKITFPENDFLPGWKKNSKQLHFNKNTLFNYIDGGAELFLEFGFQELVVQGYQNGEKEIVIESYYMENPTSALGIYLIKCGKETPINEITVRNSGNSYQFTIVKGDYYIQINNYSGDVSLRGVMITCAKQILQSIPDAGSIKILNLLPAKNLISGSERIFRGTYALQPIFTFGEGDILQLQSKVFGVLGDYVDDDGNEYTLIMISYPNSQRAASTFENIIVNLDSYLKIITHEEFRFSFIDYRNKYGLVEQRNELIKIKIHLPENPLKNQNKN